jgi:hypothetical protein
LQGDCRLYKRGALFSQLAIRNFMFLGSLLIRRSAFDAVGGFYEHLPRAEDWDLYLRLTAQFDALYTAAPISRYIKHPVARTSDISIMNRGFMSVLAHVAEAAQGLSVAERSHVRRLLRRHRFDWAYTAYDSGQFDEARDRFREAIRLSGPTLRSCAFLGLTSLSPALIAAFRATKRRLL